MAGLIIGDENAVKSMYQSVDLEELVNNLKAKSAGASSWSSTWFRSVVRKRAHAARSIPLRMMKLNGDTEVKLTDFDGRVGMPRIDFPDLIERSSIAIDRFGKAYMANITNSFAKSLEVRWLDPSTIELQYDPTDGRLLYFKRMLNGRVKQTYLYDENTRKAPGLVWAWSRGMNETGPGDTLADDCEVPAKALYMGDEVMNTLFERGAIGVLVASPADPHGSIMEADVGYTASVLRRLLQRGEKGANKIGLMKTPLKIEKISTSPNELELGPSADRWQNDICGVSDTPRILLNTVDASNRATIDRITQTWLLTTIAPQAQMIIDALNYHVLHDLGYDLQLNTAGMDVDQQEEAEKAAAWAVYVDHDVNAETAAEMLGIDIPEGLEFIDAAKVAERQATEQARMDAMRQAQAGPGNQPQQGKGDDSDMEATKAVRKIDYGKVYTDEIAALIEMAIGGEITAGQMNQAWRILATEAHTAAFKRGMGVKSNEMLLSFEEGALAGVLAKEYEAIDKAVTEIFNGLTQDTTGSAE